MKTDLRTEFNLTDEAFDIPENTIYDGPEIDPEKIRSTVMEHIRSDKKKGAGKRLTICLIAAVVSAAVIGTTVMAATGVFTPKLNDVYKGDTSFLEIQDTEEFVFHSENDELEAQFLGTVTTDEETIISVILTRKDGKEFTDAESIEVDEDHLADEIMCSNSRDGKSNMELVKENPNNIDYAYAFFTENKDGDVNGYSSMALSYVLSEDKKSIRLYINTYTLTAEDPEAYVNVVSRYAETCRYTDKLSTLDSEEKALTELYNLTDGGMTDDYRIKNETNGLSVYSVAKERLSLPYDMRIKLSYTPDKNIIEKELDSKNAPTVIKDGFSASMRVTPTRIIIETENTYTIDQLNGMQEGVGFDENNQFTLEDGTIYFPMRVSAFVDNFDDPDDRWIDLDTERSRIVMTDGTVYYLYGSNSMGYTTDEKNGHVIPVSEEKTITYSIEPTVNWSINYLTDNSKKTIIDPNAIAKLVINGDTVYTKTGFENVKVDIPAKKEKANSSIQPETFNDQDEPLPVMNFNAMLELKDRITKEYSDGKVELTSELVFDTEVKNGDDPVLKNYLELTVVGGKDDLRKLAESLRNEAKNNICVVSLKYKDNGDGDQPALTIGFENPVKSGSGLSDEEFLDYVSRTYTDKRFEDCIAAAFGD